MRRIEFWAEGTPASYSRDGARFGRTPAANLAWRGAIVIAYRLEAGPGPVHVGPVAITIDFHGARASCDGDNLSKEVLDALNGIAYEDDRQVRRCAWEIADWRQEGARSKKAKQPGARIVLEFHPADEAARAKAEAARAKARAAKARARGTPPPPPRAPEKPSGDRPRRGRAAAR